MHSEQYRRRRAFSSSVSGSVSASGSASVSRSGSEGELSSGGLSSPPAAEVVSGAVVDVVLGAIGEAAGADVGVVRVIKGVKGCASLSTGDSGRGAAPGMASAGRKWKICFESCSVIHHFGKKMFSQRALREKPLQKNILISDF